MRDRYCKTRKAKDHVELAGPVRMLHEASHEDSEDDAGNRDIRKPRRI